MMEMHVLLAWLLGVVCAAAVTPVQPFEAYRQAYGKRYSPQEAEHRQQIFMANLADIEAINRRQSSWRAGVNQFADWTWAEFQEQRLMAPQDCSATHHGTFVASGRFRPHFIDWEKKGVLTPIKNQGHCGSCWTFSTTGTLEAHHFMKTGQRVNLSEQQLVDCAGDFDNHGCNGGLPSHAFEYIKYNGGLDSEAAYPYKGVDGNCSFTCKGIAAKVHQVTNISYLDEVGIEDAVAFMGPVSIAFQVADDFRFYKSGVYNGVCSSDKKSVNHAVVAVGYGHEGGTKYWKVRNSWGPQWGEAGHFRILRGVNKCGLSDCASFPIV
eukprot:GGOE01036288.1.p1 GENE.GGOE01036288.1~~GGOE01036288.1.p1  ORF type:complete len:331 (-),score=106.24 GGOE01036288.1:293-1261(-)